MRESAPPENSPYSVTARDVRRASSRTIKILSTVCERGSSALAVITGNAAPKMSEPETFFTASERGRRSCR